MEKYLDVLKKCPLFSGINEIELQKLLPCLSAVEKHYEKNNFIFTVGDNVTAVGIVLFGSAYIIQEDFWGNRSILAHIKPGELFGEAFTCSETTKLPVSVVATQKSRVLLIDYSKIIRTCTSACMFHTRLIQNMLRVLANKNVMLMQKMEVLTRRNTRNKLLAYLSAQAKKAGSNSFEIPFNRQELAEYLSVDRSAMSSELSRMQTDGILTFHRKRFMLCIKDGENIAKK